MTISDGRDPMLDRKVNKGGAAAKSVHFHHLVFVKFDSSRGNRKIARNLLCRTALGKQLQNLSLTRCERLRAIFIASSAALGLFHHLFRQGRG